MPSRRSEMIEQIQKLRDKVAIGYDNEEIISMTSTENLKQKEGVDPNGSDGLILQIANNLK